MTPPEKSERETPIKARMEKMANDLADDGIVGRDDPILALRHGVDRIEDLERENARLKGELEAERESRKVAEREDYGDLANACEQLRSERTARERAESRVSDLEKELEETKEAGRIMLHSGIKGINDYAALQSRVSDLEAKLAEAERRERIAVTMHAGLREKWLAEANRAECAEQTRDELRQMNTEQNQRIAEAESDRDVFAREWKSWQTAHDTRMQQLARAEQALAQTAARLERVREACRNVLVAWDGDNALTVTDAVEALRAALQDEPTHG